MRLKRRSFFPQRSSSFTVASIIDLGPHRRGYFAPRLRAVPPIVLDLTQCYAEVRIPDRVRTLDLTKQVEVVCSALPKHLRKVENIDRAAREVHSLIQPNFPNVPLGKIGELVFDALD